eukprot:TRINITY_DN952_c0_g1_i1.p1 TRINITY_DN952_c0_g1~~TRINITY_DN952_c0_g1_i1.p1  ORF type:complete len:137 (-),score=26.02 TRINITY_DN952_c0_g1_i1:74-484(-)
MKVSMITLVSSTLVVALLFIQGICGEPNGNMIPGFEEPREKDSGLGGGGGGAVQNAVNPDDLIDTKMLSGCDHLHKTGGAGGGSGFSESWNMPHVHEEDIYTGGGGFGFVPAGGEGTQHTLEQHQNPPSIKDELRK